MSQKTVKMTNRHMESKFYLLQICPIISIGHPLMAWNISSRWGASICLSHAWYKVQTTYFHRRDARSLPDVTRVANPYELPGDHLQPPTHDFTPSHPALPTLEWRTIYKSHFYNFRRVCLTAVMHFILLISPEFESTNNTCWLCARKDEPQDHAR